MKTVKYLGIFFLIVCCCISCCADLEFEGMEIFIQNRTEDTLSLTLFTKRDIGGLYLRYDNGGSGYRHTNEFLLPNPEGKYRNWEKECIFITSKLDTHPSKIIFNEFDSIYISTANKDHVIVKFTHESVTGYSDNIFSENSTWSIIKGITPRKGLRHCEGTFLILKDKLVIE